MRNHSRVTLSACAIIMASSLTACGDDSAASALPDDLRITVFPIFPNVEDQPVEGTGEMVVIAHDEVSFEVMPSTGDGEGFSWSDEAAETDLTEVMDAWEVLDVPHDTSDNPDGEPVPFQDDTSDEINFVVVNVYGEGYQSSTMGNGDQWQSLLETVYETVPDEVINEGREEMRDQLNGS